MSHKVYFQRPLAPDALLGRVEADGKVYESRFGPDKYVGRVELDTGKIYEARLGPDKYVGQVMLDSGKVYRHKPMAADEYLGSVDGDGKFFRHRPLAADEYLGQVVEMTSYAHGGAAFLLLIWPMVEEELEARERDPEGKQKAEAEEKKADP